MAYCARCEAEEPDGLIYCPECGFRLVETQQRSGQGTTPEQGQRMGEAFEPAAESADAPHTPPRRSGRFRGPAEAWAAVGVPGQVIFVGVFLAIIGFFIPSTRIIPPGAMLTQSLAMIGGGYLLVPVLSITALVLLYFAGQRRPLRNRLYLHSTVIAIGAFILPVGLYVWLNGLLGGLVILVAAAAIIGGGYALMAGSTHSLG